MQVSGPGFAQEVRLFLGGACPPWWLEASETMGKLLASRGVSEEAGTNKSMAGIDVISRFVTCFSSHADFLRSRLGRAHTTTSAQF